MIGRAPSRHHCSFGEFAFIATDPRPPRPPADRRRSCPPPAAAPPFTSLRRPADVRGRVAARAYPNDVRVHHVYTVHGHLGSVWHARSTSGEELAWAADAVDAKGRLTSEVYGNGLMGLYDYHPQSDRLQEIRIGTAPNGEAVGEAVTQYYGYDNLGRLINKSDTQATLASPSAPTAFTYGYDALDRLTSTSDYQGTVSQTYEANGNLKTKNIKGARVGLFFAVPPPL